MTAQTILPANTLSSGYDVANSGRFDIAGTDTLRLAAAGSDGDMKHWTISMWIKRSKLGALQHVWSWSRNSTNAEGGLYFDANDQLVFINDGQNGSSNEIDGVFRDPSAWFHLVWACDADDGTNANRWKVYINGVQRTITGGPTISDANGIINQGSTQEHWIGGRARSLNDNVADASYFSGYLAEVVFIDDTTLDPTSFGEFDSDSGIWKPIDVSGLTFGAEGYYLDFENASELGTDQSGNSNTLAENSMDATNQSTDTCTNNFATMNSIANQVSGVTFKDGNLGVAMTNNKGGSTSTFGLTTGKWYVEMNITTIIIDRIQDSQGNTISNNEKRFCENCDKISFDGNNVPIIKSNFKQIFSPQTAYQMTSILEGAIERGTGKSLRDLNLQLAGKTGTTNNNTDTWFIGFTSNLVVGVYVGFDNPKRLGKYETGSKTALPIFKEFIKKAVNNYEARPFKIAKGIKMMVIDAETGKKADFGSKKTIIESYKKEKIENQSYSSNYKNNSNKFKKNILKFY